MVRAEILLLICGMGLATYATRFIPFLFFGDRDLPERMKVFLKYIPVAILSAIVLPEVLLLDGQLALSYHNQYLIAAICASVVAFFTKNVIYTVVVGMAVVIFL